MSTSYDRIAGQSVERSAALSDGVFAVAMTLLVLDLRAPAVEAVHNEQDLWLALGALAPRLVMCAMTFMTLGIFWVGQQTQLNHLSRSDRSLSWMHILFVFAVSMTPFSTMLLAGFIAYRIALLVYWVNLLLGGHAVLHVGVCAGPRPGAGRHSLSGGRRHQAPDRHRTGALCIRRAAVHGEHLFEHRIHRLGATELRDRAPPSRARPVILIQVGENT
jgi:hypothetical protein